MALVAVTACDSGCHRGQRSRWGMLSGEGGATVGAGGARSVARAGAESLPVTNGNLAGVVDPWTWPRAAGASDRERAIESIGPYEAGSTQAGASPVINTNADYWTNLVGLAWWRDVDIDFDDEPVDLDGDGVADTRVTRHIHARGGILANPTLFGLIPTPDDPRGRVGRISVSTGVLGLREALTSDGKPSGQIGMTCFLCHGGRDPADGRIVFGLPGVAFDYGLLLATAAVLDDDNAQASTYRHARRFPPGRTVRARLLLAGPGRQDLTGEFGLDVTVPGFHSATYAGTARVRQGTSGIVNPISVPGILGASGVDLQNWSGSEIASARWLRRLIALGRRPAGETLRALRLPSVSDESERDAVATRRALLFDLRNLGTLGLQQDSFPGLLWADAIYGRADLPSEAVLTIPQMYAAAALRRVVQDEALARLRVGPSDSDPTRAAAIARGRDIFSDRIVGVVANRQILKEPPARYAAAKPGGADHLPIVAPIDEALPSRFSVRCADCHSATPGGAPVALSTAALPFGRCSHCHRAHIPLDDSAASRPRGAGAPGVFEEPERSPVAPFNGVFAPAGAETFPCTGCHARHRPFAPVVYSSSLLLPFDADGDGRAQDDEGDDHRAGGIGTEALLAFDVPRPQRPPAGFSLDLPTLSRVHTVGPISTSRIGVSWVRVPPLVRLRATAPYLHNGSVPTLRALLEPARRRPVTFPLGQAGFVFDTRIAGNRNIGHEYGTKLSAREKADLVAFLDSL